MPRSGNASGGGQPGWAVRCAPGGPNDYIYVIVQPVGWEPLAGIIGRPELADDPDWATPEARLPKLDKMFQLIEEWTIGHDKWEALDRLNAVEHPVRADPVAPRSSSRTSRLRREGMVVEVDHPERGAFTTVGSPLQLSDSPVDVTSSPLLGEHNERGLRRRAGPDRRGAGRPEDERSHLTDRTTRPPCERCWRRPTRPEGRTALTAPEGKRICRRVRHRRRPARGWPTSADEAVSLADGDRLAGRAEDRLARHPAQDRGRRRARRAEDARGGARRLRPDHGQRARLQPRRAASTASRCSRWSRGGHEVIVGAVTDPTFGKLVAFGLGGVLVEVLQGRDLPARPAVAATTRSAMLDEHQGGRVLRGVRGARAGEPGRARAT